jgi:hypothetical protein
VCIQGQTHGFWTLKPVAFFTCYVEKKEHHVLFLSLSLSLSPELDKANLVTEDKETQIPLLEYFIRPLYSWK